MMPKNILGISFKEYTQGNVLHNVKEIWQAHSRLRIATVNPEFLIASEKDSRLKENLSEADIRVVDGIGLWLALRMHGWQGARITGAALTEQLLFLAEAENRSVLIILKTGGLSSLMNTQEALLQKYPNLTVSVVYENETFPPADLTLIALGIPEQEYVAAHVSKGVVMGVGGSIDFLTGVQKRAPKFFQNLGLEWLWRLLLQPRRLKRIWNAVIVFPYLVIFK